jgi:hypothetical protein
MMDSLFTGLVFVERGTEAPPDAVGWRAYRGRVIPDIEEAVESPHRLSNEPEVAQRLLDLVPHVPTPVWGRDELGAGEMWNSNSTGSWLLVWCGLDVESIQPRLGGRAPGWHAGIVVALRQREAVSHEVPVWAAG